MRSLLFAALFLLMPCQKGSAETDALIRYYGDRKEYVIPSEYVYDVLPDKTLGADEFTEKYWEPLRAENPDYIAREAIGVDDSGKYTMWCYTFTPRKYKTTVYLQAGIHGRNEFESYFAAALMMRLITDAASLRDPHLKYLRKNVRFIIVPLVNVYDPSERTCPPNNASNINLNRDWIDARSQEVRNIKTLLSRYAPGEISLALDLHTDPEGNPGWGAYLLPYADDLPSSISDKFLAVNNFLYDINIPGKVLYKGEDLMKAFMGPKSEYPSSSREWRAHYNEDYKRGTAWKSVSNGIWKDMGIPSSTLEHGARKFGPEGSAVEMTRAIELYLNHIVTQIGK